MRNVLRRGVLVCLLLVVAPASVLAELSGDGSFDDYASMRAFLDKNMMHRNIKDVMYAFGAAQEMTASQLVMLEAQVRQVYRKNLDHVDLLVRKDLKAGWRQEMLVYWRDRQFIYVHLLIQKRGDGIMVVNFEFNSDFQKIKNNL